MKILFIKKPAKYRVSHKLFYISNIYNASNGVFVHEMVLN